MRKQRQKHTIKERRQLGNEVKGLISASTATIPRSITFDPKDYPTEGLEGLKFNAMQLEAEAQKKASEKRRLEIEIAEQKKKEASIRLASFRTRNSHLSEPLLLRYAN